MIKKLKYKARRIEFEPPRENTGVKVFVFLMAALSLIFSYILQLYKFFHIYIIPSIR